MSKKQKKSKKSVAAKVATKPKQQQLKGLEQEKDKRIVRLAETYVEKRDARISVQREEISAKQVLIQAMKDKKILRYEDADDDLLVLLTPGKDSLKVKPLSEQDEDEMEDGNEGEDDVVVERDGKAAAAGESNGANGHDAAAGG